MKMSVALIGMGLLFVLEYAARAEGQVAAAASKRSQATESEEGGEQKQPVEEIRQFNAGAGYGMTNISNSNSLSDVITGLAGKGPYATFAWTPSDRHVIEAQLGIFENEQLLAKTKATFFMAQWKFFWTPLLYQSLALDYSGSKSDLTVSNQANASYGTKRLIVHSGIGNRLQISRFTVDLEYLALGYMASVLSESYGIDDPVVRQLYRADEKQATGTLVFYRALHLAIGFDI